jgi:hypothetical protein
VTQVDCGAPDATMTEHELRAQLLERYGPVLGGGELRKVLGFSTAGAFRQATLRGTVPVPTFTVPNRRGRFALTQEVARWLYERRRTAIVPA